MSTLNCVFEVNRASNHVFNSLLEQVPGGVYTLVLSASGRLYFEYLNAWFGKIYGIPLAELAKHPEEVWLSKMYPDDRDGFWQVIALSAETQTPLHYIWRSVTAENEQRWLETQAQPSYRENGEVCWHGILLDVSDRCQVSPSEACSTVQYQELVSALPDLIFRVSRSGIWLGTVQNIPELDCFANIPHREGQPLTALLPPAIAARQLQALEKALSTGQPQVFEQQVMVGDRCQDEEVRVVPYKPDEALFIIRNISDRKATERQLRTTQAEMQAIVSAIPDLIFRIHRDGTFLNYFSNHCRNDLLQNINPVGRNITEFATNSLLQDHITEHIQAIHHALDLQQVVVYEQVIEVEDAQVDEEVRVVPIDENEALVIVRDISDRKAAEFALKQSEAQNQAILRAIPDLMLQLRRDGLILASWSGENCKDMLGQEVRYVGRNLADFATTPDLKRHLDRKLAATRRILDTGEMEIYEQEVTIDGQIQYEEVRIVPSGSDAALVIIRDISDRKRAEMALQLANERLEQLSRTDSLTGLANRRSLDEYFNREWRRAIREQQPISFILFDLDYFKRYNDTYGHPMGDTCLVQVAQAAMSTVNRSSDLVARYGGEEFAVVLVNTGLQGAYQIAERIRQTVLQLNIPHHTSPVSDRVTLSLGVSSMIPVLGTQPNALIRQADQALYAAKAAGRNNCQCYTPSCISEQNP